MARSYDIVALGAGHNGLVAAAYLAKAGKEVLLVERNVCAGGGVVTRELTLPGFFHDQHSTTHMLLFGSPMIQQDELGLVPEHGREDLGRVEGDPVELHRLRHDQDADQQRPDPIGGPEERQDRARRHGRAAGLRLVRLPVLPPVRLDRDLVRVVEIAADGMRTPPWVCEVGRRCAESVGRVTRGDGERGQVVQVRMLITTM